MTALDIEETYGAARFRVDFVLHGQQAPREVYEVGSKGTVVGFFVDGIVTELENLGRMPDDTSFDPQEPI